MSRAAIALALLCACGEAPASPDAEVEGPVEPVFDPRVLDGEGAFFDLPYPSDLRTDARGHPVLRGFPRARGLVASAIALVESERPGFSPITAVYFRFTGALDEASLPSDPAGALDDASAVLLIDVDAASPERGRRLPAYARFVREPTAFWPGNALVVRPVPGVHFHPGRRYAAVVRDRLRARGGAELVRSRAFDEVTEGGGALAAHYAELFEALSAAGVDRSTILVASAFTTSDPAREMDLARAFVAAQLLPEVRGWTELARRPAERHFEAELDVYELLDGEPPYATFGSGRIHFAAGGAPARVTRRAVKVGLSVPTSAAPAGGYPLVLYGHGTGGDHRTHLGAEGTALATAGLATLGFEAALHGGRSSGEIAIETLILSNPIAARETVRQTVIDQMLFARLIAAGSFDVPAAVAGEPVALARGPLRYMGHSQGAQEAGVLLGVEPSIEAAFLSAGGGGGVITIVERSLGGMPIACTVASVIGERSCADVAEDHPALMLLVQPLLDPADPLSFAHRFLRERPDGFAPLHVAMTEGTADDATPPRTIEALAAAIGLPVVEPVVQESDPLRLTGGARATPPVRENLALASGARVTGGLMQWAGGTHFAIYQIEDARRRYVEFFRTAIAGAPTIVGP